MQSNQIMLKAKTVESTVAAMDSMAPCGCPKTEIEIRTDNCVKECLHNNQLSARDCETVNP